MLAASSPLDVTAPECRLLQELTVCGYSIIIMLAHKCTPLHLRTQSDSDNHIEQPLSMSESDCVQSMFRSGVHLWATYDLLQCLLFIAASFSFCVVHATSRAAVAAEAISRNKLVVLFNSKLDLDLSPSTLPQTLPALVY